MTAVLDPTGAAGAPGLAVPDHGVSGSSGRRALPRLVDRPLAPLVTGGALPYADLDVAASAPPLRAVADHVAALLPWYASVHRGAGHASQVCTAVLERARATVGAFVGARPDDVTVFTRNTTDALNLLAGAVPGPVLRLDVEHHANLLAWGAGGRVLRAASTVERTVALVRAALAARPHALLAVTGASNVTGETLPIARLADVAHAAGARVVVDAAQLAPHHAIDIAAAGVDYVALSGHKLYAPYGAGALVGRRDWLDVAAPHLAGGGAVRQVWRGRSSDTAEVSWAPAPHRHEAGTPNVVGAAALAHACRTLAPVLDGTAQAHEWVLRTRLDAGLDALAGVRRLRIFRDDAGAPEPDRVAVTSFTVDGVPSGLVAAYLSAEHGIGVRDGRFCAHPLLARLAGAKADGAVRASVGVGTTAVEIDRLLAALDTLLRHGPRWTYAQVDGRWTPTPDPRDPDPLGLAALDDATPTIPTSPCGS